MFVGELRDDRATPCPANQQALGHQFFDRAADRADADAEFLGQLRLRRELGAGRPLAGTKALENTGADDFIERLLSRSTKSWHSGQCQSEEKESEKAARSALRWPRDAHISCAASGPIRGLHGEFRKDTGSTPACVTVIDAMPLPSPITGGN